MNYQKYKTLKYLILQRIKNSNEILTMTINKQNWRLSKYIIMNRGNIVNNSLFNFINNKISLGEIVKIETLFTFNKSKNSIVKYTDNNNNEYFIMDNYKTH